MPPITFPGDEVDPLLRGGGGRSQCLRAGPPSPPNAFFEQFPNVYTFAGVREFRSQLQRALVEDPRALGEEHRRILSWARGTGRNEEGGIPG